MGVWSEREGQRHTDYLVPNDRQMRIEVGYRLEGIMPDLMASRIIQYIMTPKFKDGDYDGGITDGTLAVIRILEGGYVEEASGTMDEDASSKGLGLSDMESPNISVTDVFYSVLLYLES